MADNNIINIQGSNIALANVAQGTGNTIVTHIEANATAVGGSQTEGFVFVSHVSEDKQRLRPYLERLMDGGIPLWIDRPEEIGFGARYPVKDRIGYGSDWRQSIRHALEEARAILVFWSRHTFEVRRDEFWSEVRHGFDRGNLVQVQLDGQLNDGRQLIAALDPRLTSSQIVDVSGLEFGASERKVDRLVDDLRRRLIDRK